MGAVAFTNLTRTVEGTQQVVRGTGTMAASYATSGDTVSLTELGLTRLDALRITSPGLGVLLRWNGSRTAPTVAAYRDVTPAANAALGEVAAAQNLAATGVFQFEAVGA